MWFAFRMQQEVAKAQTSFSVHGSCTACLSFLNGGPITIKSVALKRETPIHPTLNPIFAETSCALLGGRVTTAPSLCLLSSVLPPHRFYCRSTHLEGHSGPISNPHQHANCFRRSMGHRTYTKWGTYQVISKQSQVNDALGMHMQMIKCVYWMYIYISKKDMFTTAHSVRIHVFNMYDTYVRKLMVLCGIWFA